MKKALSKSTPNKKSKSFSLLSVREMSLVVARKLALNFFFAFSFLIMMSCNNHKDVSYKQTMEKTYNVAGKINGMDSGWLYIGTYDTTEKTFITNFDSTRVINSYFRFKGKFTNSIPCKIMVKDVAGWPYTHYFILDTGLIKIQLFKDSMQNSIITGPKSQEQYMDFNKKLNVLIIQYGNRFSLCKKGIISADSLNKMEEEFYRKKHELLLQEVKTNPSPVISAFIVENNLDDAVDIPTLEKMCNSLTNKDNYFARSLLKLLNAKKNSGIGTRAPYFNVIDSKSQELTNETFKGKYLLIDFWASWCGPCREETPYLVKVYKKFAGKGLEIISISSDTNKEKWKDAIKKDKMSWLQVFDLKGPDSKIGKDYGVRFIPANFLIDKQGKIVAENLRGNDLEKELQKYLGTDSMK